MEDKKQKSAPAPLWITSIQQLDDEMVEVVAHFGGIGSKYRLTATFGIEATKELRIGTKLLLDIG